MVGQWIKGWEITDAQSARSNLKASYARIYARVQKDYETQEGKGQISEKAAEQIAPILAMLKTSSELVGGAIANGLNKRPIMVHTPVTVTVVNNPGSRAASRVVNEALRQAKGLTQNLGQGADVAGAVKAAGPVILGASNILLDKL